MAESRDASNTTTPPTASESKGKEEEKKDDRADNFEESLKGLKGFFSIPASCLFGDCEHDVEPISLQAKGELMRSVYRASGAFIIGAIVDILNIDESLLLLKDRMLYAIIGKRMMNASDSKLRKIGELVGTYIPMVMKPRKEKKKEEKKEEKKEDK